MKSIQLIRVLLFLGAAVIQLPAQQNEADRKRFEEIKDKAAKGDAQSQFDLGAAFEFGLGVTTNQAESVKWYRKAADQNNPYAQFNLGLCYSTGHGVVKDEAETVKWWRKAAEQGLPAAQANLGAMYYDGYGLPKNSVEAMKWYRKAAEQGNAVAQSNLGLFYYRGEAVPKDTEEALKWLRKAAHQGHATAQCALGIMYDNGEGLPKDYVEAYKWFNLATVGGNEEAAENRSIVEHRMTASQIAEAQRLSREFKPRKAVETGSYGSREGIAASQPSSTGTGFFITEDGFLITNEHVVKEAAQVRLVTSAGLIAAMVVKVDAANDLALLKAEGRFAALPVVASRAMRLGSTVATVGFPNVGLQGFAPKLARGEITALSGAQDDARYFQISVPVQPGNSGGALVDERGNVVGVVSAKLSARAALAATGALPENVNYAVKSSFLLSFLEAVPEVSSRVGGIKDENIKNRKFEDVVKSAEQAAVLVLVY